MSTKKAYVNIKADEDLQNEINDTIVLLGGDMAVMLKWPDKLRVICKELRNLKEGIKEGKE